VAILDNGFSIRHYRRESAGSQVRLYVSPQGNSFVDVPASSIVQIQLDETAPNVPVARKEAQSPPTDRSLEEVVAHASNRHGIDPDLIRSVIAAESGFNPGAVSPKGAQGLMQLMPDTASSLGVENAFDPEGNVDGGTRYLRELLVLYNGDLAKTLAAYNAGPERVELYKGVPPYPETRAYVSRVIREFNRQKMKEKAAKAGGSQ
jgi:soluble lytic murein transglycosylase-like protein